MAAGLPRRFFAGVHRQLRVFPADDAGQHVAGHGAGRVEARTSFARGPVGSGVVVIIGYTASSRGGSAAAAGKAMLEAARGRSGEAAPPGSCARCCAPRSSSSRARAVARAQLRVRGTRGDAQCGVGIDDRDLTAAGFAVSMSLSRPAVLDRAPPQRLRRAPRSGSGTRVVVKRRAIESRHAAAAAAIDPDDLADVVSRIGPYVVRDPARTAEPSAVSRRFVDGYDDRLRRKVWIEFDSAGHARAAAAQARSRPPREGEMAGGRRTADECWDAFEAIPGQPLTRRDRDSAAVVARAALAERSHARDRPGARRRIPSRSGDRPGLGRRGRSRPASGLAGPSTGLGTGPSTGLGTGARQRLAGGHDWACAGSGSRDGRPVSVPRRGERVAGRAHRRLARPRGGCRRRFRFRLVVFCSRCATAGPGQPRR